MRGYEKVQKNQRTRKYRRRRLTPFGKFVKGCLICMMTSLIILGAIRVQAYSSSEDHARVRMEKVYTSVQIHPGDTLWSIAKEYSDAENNTQLKKYIKEIRSINHIENDRSLRAGAYLMVYHMVESE